MKILITGAGGFIGSHLLRALQRAGHEVIAAVHQSRRTTDAAVIPCNFMQDTTVERWRNRLTGVDVVINTVGIIHARQKQTFQRLHADTPIALFQACTECGVKKVIQISALGADETAFSTYHLTKRRADDVLRTLDIDWTILRPSVVYGNGAKSMALFRAMAALPLIPLPGKGEQTLQPVSIDDLIQVVLNVLNAKIPARQTIDLIGPESLTLQQLYRQLRQWLGLGKARFINLPWRVTLIMAWLTGLFSRSVFNLQSMQMLQRGYTLPPASTTHHIIQTQTRLTDALSASVCNPAEYQVARLRFVLPLLRISIALLWIWTGLVSIFFFPVSESYALLAQFNLHGMQADLALYGGALLDFICGLALLLNYRSKQVYALMLLIMTAYTVLITLALPAFWLHPFGPISKNFPLFIATLLLMVTEEPRYGLSPA